MVLDSAWPLRVTQLWWEPIGDDDNGSRQWIGLCFYTHRNCIGLEQAKLTASDGAANDHFGVSVAIAGDTIVVGAYGDDDSGSDSGSAYVFTRTGTTWTEQTKLTASDGAAGDQFGTSVAITGDTIVVGADLDDTASGSAYVFTRTGTAWMEQAKLTASDGAAVDSFGISVAIVGDTIVVGAWLDIMTMAQTVDLLMCSRAQELLGWSKPN